MHRLFQINPKNQPGKGVPARFFDVHAFFGLEGLFLIGVIIILAACTHLKDDSQGIVPNVMGLPSDHAAYYLEQAGMPYDFQNRAVEQINQNGVILEQIPAPGEVLETGARIHLIVGLKDVEKTDIPQIPPFPSVTLTTTDTLAETTMPGTKETGDSINQMTSTIAPSLQFNGGGSGWLVYASYDKSLPQLWRVKVDGSEPAMLTDQAKGACQPDWSPDGEKLVFVSPCDGQHDVYPDSSLWLVDADGRNVQVLPDMKGGNYDPAWSPDGNFIAFTSNRDGGPAQLYLYDVQNQKAHNLSNNAANESQPDWAPDANRLLYISPASGGTGVMIRNVDGEAGSQFTRETGRNFINPQWSPDDSNIIVGVAPSGGVPFMMKAPVIDQGFTLERMMTSYPMPIRDASLSPDGDWIVYESWLDGSNHDIWIQSLDGYEQIRITREKSFDFDADWMP